MQSVLRPAAALLALSALLGAPLPATAHEAPRPSAAAPVFKHRTLPVTKASLGRTYRSGCPVPPARLRLLRMSHWGFDGKVHTGSMVVNERVAKDVVYVFRTAFDTKFPIRMMRPVSAYGGSDLKSMADDNTSAFNCRQVTGNPGVLSQHSHGDAIDVNPLENPYVDRNGRVHPPSAARYLNRSLRAKGMIYSDSPITKAFRRIGWEWGGRWYHPDYQHFSLNGR